MLFLSRRRWTLLPTAVVLLAATGVVLFRADHQRSTVLWIWERPESIRFSSDRTSFAVLTGSFDVDHQGVHYHARRQPVDLPAGARPTAVFRIDTEPGASLPISSIADQILRALPQRGAGVQVDFDARQSERQAYRELLNVLRQRLPSGAGLSMTALASWCQDDPWIRDLPVDEAVPMLFRMGAQTAEIRRFVERGHTFRVPLCRESVGLSTDEPMWRLPRGIRRVYVFSPRPWTRRTVAMAENTGVLR